MKKYFLALAALLLFVPRAVPAATDCAAPVSTAQGPVTGLAEPGLDACVYRGIPYAAPPVGELRFRPPAPAPGRTSALAATAFSKSCIQPGLGADQSEDCLYLNVWRPKAPGAYPVMVWIHGGGLIGGSGSSPGSWGDRLAARREVVVVTINYRLGPLGFLALPELREEDPEKSVGNYGLLDQVAALRWVKDNIAAFGGDPSRVTIFGCSAGGWSVCNLVGTPAAAGLFSGAIIESGGCDIVETVDEGFATGEDYAQRLGCASDRLSCLRKLDADRLRAGIDPDFGRDPRTIAAEREARGGRNLLDYARWPWRPHLDGKVMSETPLAALAAGRFNRVPIMAGAGRDEFIHFTPWRLNIHFLPRSRVQSLLVMALGTEAERRVEALYPWRDYRDPGAAAVAALGDMAFGCRCFGAAEAAAAFVPVFHWRFEFDRHMFPHMIGATHCDNVKYVFDTLDRSGDMALFNPVQRRWAGDLVPVLSGYWTNFAKTGNPNGPGLANWPAFTTAAPATMRLDLPAAAGPADLKEKCAFWDTQKQPLK